MVKYDAGGVGTVLVGAAMFAGGVMSNMPVMKDALGGLSGGHLIAGGAAVGAIGVAYMLASQ